MYSHVTGSGHTRYIAVILMTVEDRVEGVWSPFAGALEQETWSSVQVPSDSQHLIQDWADRTAQLKTAYTSPAKRASNLTNGDKLPPGKWQCLGLGC